MINMIGSIRKADYKMRIRYNDEHKSESDD